MADEEQMTSEEAVAAYNARRKALIADIKKDLPSLRIEAEYYELLAKIDVAKLNRFTASYEMASIKSQINKAPDGDNNGGTPGEDESLPDNKVSDSNTDAAK